MNEGPFVLPAYNTTIWRILTDSLQCWLVLRITPKKW